MQETRLTKYPVMVKVEKYTYLFLLSIGVALMTIFASWWFQPSHIPVNFSGFGHVFDFVLFLTLSYIVWYQVINEAFSWYIAGFMKKPKPMEPEAGLKVAFLTAFVPDKEPLSMLKRTLTAMKNADYPHETWLLDEGASKKAQEICRKLRVKYFTRFGWERYNTVGGPFRTKTKGGNYNAWFDWKGDQYDIVAQLDVDFIPKKDYLTKTLGYFRDPDVAFVGTPQIYGNVNQSWIVKGAAEQAYNFYGSIQKGLFGFDMQLFIGANHVFRVKAHNSIDGYSGHVVEDHLTGMKLYSKRWKSVYVPEKLAVGEGPATWSSYFSQQMRWAFGLIDILFRHSPNIFKNMRKVHAINYFWLQQYYFFGLAQVLGISLLSLFFLTGIQSTSMHIKPLLEMYLPLILFQQIFTIWLQRFNIDPKTERGLMLRGKLLNLAVWPIYFLALLGVIANKRINYVVTPKGANQGSGPNPSHFIPHLILGTITLVMLLIAHSKVTHGAEVLKFWAVVNTIAMLGFFFSETIGLIASKMKNLPGITPNQTFELPNLLSRT